jgi:hypothetical protein
VIAIIFGVSGAGKQQSASCSRANLGGVLLKPTIFILPLSAGKNGVLACSALKRAYRDRLRVGDKVKFVFLCVDYALVEDNCVAGTGIL